MGRRIGLTQEQAIEALWVMAQNSSRQFVWLVFWIAHFALALVCFALLWWFQVTPEQLTSSVLGWSQSKTASLLGFAGLSVAGVVAAYLALARWVWSKTYARWHTEKILEGLGSNA